MDSSLVYEALDVLDSAGASYGDVRLEQHMRESITVVGEKPEVIRKTESLGYGIRVFWDGAWGFCAGSKLSKKEIKKTAQNALNIAKASRKASSQKEIYKPCRKIKDHYTSPVEKDPFSVALEEKLALLTGATRALMKNKSIHQAKGFSDAAKVRKIFASTKGSFITQEITRCGGGILAMAIKQGEVQIRSFPTSFRGNFATAGWEFVEAMKLEQNAPKVAQQALLLLKAPNCPAFDDATIILAPDQLALQIHESIGHPIELDRVFGQEASFAGTSFLRPKMRDSFTYASPHVSVVADATTPQGLGTFGYDDEGVPAQKFFIIQKGIFRNFLSSCKTAPRLSGKNRSNGTARAENWNNIPLIRMTNINLEPGNWDLYDLIEDTKKGILLETNKSWSIDDKRINFQFGTEVAREIKNGKLGRYFKNPVYTGITNTFWKSCDAVCTDRYWKLYGIPNCGKGEPMQMMHVGHGASYARFRGVRVGSANL